MVEAVSVALNCKHDVCLILPGQGASGEAQLHLHLTAPNRRCQEAQALDLESSPSSLLGWGCCQTNCCDQSWYSSARIVLTAGM